MFLDLAGYLKIPNVDRSAVSNPDRLFSRCCWIQLPFSKGQAAEPLTSLFIPLCESERTLSHSLSSGGTPTHNNKENISSPHQTDIHREILFYGGGLEIFSLLLWVGVPPEERERGRGRSDSHKGMNRLVSGSAAWPLLKGSCIQHIYGRYSGLYKGLQIQGRGFDSHHRRESLYECQSGGG